MGLGPPVGTITSDASPTFMQQAKAERYTLCIGDKTTTSPVPKAIVSESVFQSGNPTTVGDKFPMPIINGVLQLNPAPFKESLGSIGKDHWGIALTGISVEKIGV